MTDERPASPGATFAPPRETREPLVEIEVERRAVALDGLETATCLQCGEAKADMHGVIGVPGAFKSVQLSVGLCGRCRDKANAAYAKVRRLDRVTRGIYFAQLAALLMSVAGGGGGFLVSALSVLLVGTLGGSFFARRRWLRDLPRLVAVKPTSVRLRVPRSWARVLLDEKPRALVDGPLSPPALPEGPR